MPVTVSSVTLRKPSPLPVPGARSASRGARRDAVAERSPVRAVVLPGSGSDARFVHRAFAAPLAEIGVALHAVHPRPGADVVAGYRAALDAALDAPGPVLVGGISLGAHVAAAWAAQHGARADLAGLLLALPAWTGPPGAAPAAAAARITAAQVRSGGMAAAVAAARAGTPAWLAAELARAWAGYGAGLADALETAAAEPAPDAAALGGIAVPVGIAALVDDPVHPLATARAWAGLLPRAQLSTTTLAALGADPAVLGRAAVRAWRRAAGCRA